jgi:hypothetical protein
MDLKRWQKERLQGPRIFLLEWTAKSPAVAVTGCRNQKQSAIALHNPGSGPHGGGGNHPNRVHFPFLVKWVGRRPPTLAGDKQRDTAPQLGNKQTVLRENGALRRAVSRVHLVASWRRECSQITAPSECVDGQMEVQRVGSPKMSGKCGEIGPEIQDRKTPAALLQGDVAQQKDACAPPRPEPKPKSPECEIPTKKRKTRRGKSKRR